MSCYESSNKCRLCHFYAGLLTPEMCIDHANDMAKDFCVMHIPFLLLVLTSVGGPLSHNARSEFIIVLRTLHMKVVPM
jgi:hypothetical protein